jgi:hypothetical protein
MTSNPGPTRVPDSELEFDEDPVYKWRGQIFTGIGFENTRDGGLSEISYLYGAQEGIARDWYPSGALKGESNYHDNVLHGITREFAEDGRIMTESRYEYGILVERRERTAEDRLVTIFTIDPNGAAYDLLEHYRRERGWA